MPLIFVKFEKSSLAEMDVNIKKSPVLIDTAAAFGFLLCIFSAPFSLHLCYA